MRRRLIKIYGGIFAVGIPYLIWLLITDIRIPCLFYEATGLPCPGCGTTRMFLSLFRLDLPSAFRYNPPMFLLLPVWNAVAVGCWFQKPRWVSSPRFLYTLLGVSVAVFLVFGIARIVY